MSNCVPCDGTFAIIFVMFNYSAFVISCNLCKLELTYITVLLAWNGELGSSIAREGSRLRGLI